MYININYLPTQNGRNFFFFKNIRNSDWCDGSWYPEFEFIIRINNKKKKKKKEKKLKRMLLYEKRCWLIKEWTSTRIESWQEEMKIWCVTMFEF